MFYEIALPVQVTLPTPVGRPLFQDDEPVTEVGIEFIDLGRVEWRDLAGRKFRFPAGLYDEYPDGGIYLGGTHNSAYLTRLRFGERQGPNTDQVFPKNNPRLSHLRKPIIGVFLVDLIGII